VSLYDDLAKSDPQLAPGVVYCHACRRSEKVDSAECLRYGWPLFCGFTMYLDKPEEIHVRGRKRSS
jgi:hypothetical protein